MAQLQQAGQEYQTKKADWSKTQEPCWGWGNGSEPKEVGFTLAKDLLRCQRGHQSCSHKPCQISMYEHKESLASLLA